MSCMYSTGSERLITARKVSSHWVLTLSAFKSHGYCRLIPKSAPAKGDETKVSDGLQRAKRR